MTSRRYDWLYRNGLSVLIVGLFLVFWAGQALTGWMEYNETLKDAGRVAVTLPQYLGSGGFMQATFENWESEFLQMAVYVYATIWLRQQGSSESKPLYEKVEVDREPVAHRRSPWPVRKGGWILVLYKHSLTIVLLLLFLLSFAAHAAGSYAHFRFEESLEGRMAGSFADYMVHSRFWFESFQNWQSEFLAIGSVVILSIWLRQHGSPESKPVDMPHDETPA